MFDELDRLADAGALDELIARARRALAGADEETARDLHHYLSWAHFERDEMEAALEHARQADDPLDEARALFHLWRFDEARRALDECPDDAEAHWYRSLLAEFEGKDPRPHLDRAIRRDPDRYTRPVRLTPEEVDAVVRGALSGLPPQLAWILDETAIEVRPLPAKASDVDPLSLGLYIGGPRTHDQGIALPPRIEIYTRNIERIAQDREDAIAELRTTLLHEFGHHFGFDEEGLASLGLD